MLATIRRTIKGLRVSPAADFRALILNRLEQLGKTKRWLAQEMKGHPSQNLIYTYLRGECDMTSDNLARVLDRLGIQIVTPTDGTNGKAKR